MAYIIPSGDSVNFDFLVDSYAPPGGSNVNFLFVEDLIIDEGNFFGQMYAAEVPTEDDGGITTQSWVVEVFPLWEFTQAYAVGAAKFEDALLDVVYAVLAPVDLGELLLDSTWAVDDVPNETLEHETYYAVDAVIFENLNLTQTYGVTSSPAFDVLFGALWFLSPGVAQDTVIVYSQETQIETVILYSLGATDIAQETIIEAALLQDVAVDDVIDSNMGQVGDDTIILSRITDDAQIETIIDGQLQQTVAEDVVIAGEIKSTTTVQTDDVILYSILTDTIVQVGVVPTVTIKGQTLPVEDASVDFDEGQFAWTCQIALRDPAHYSLFEANDSFAVDVLGEVYTFILDSKEFARGSATDLRAVIAGISPSALFATPRAARITKTWDTAVLVTDVVTELFSGAAVWEIINWSIPAFRLAAADQTPIEILQLLARAAGGTVISDPDGTIRARPLFPIAVPVFLISTPDQEYSDVEHNFNVRETFTHFALVNKLRILDVAQDAFSDTVEFEVSDLDRTRGKLKVFPQPWRTTVEMRHTSRLPVSVTKVGVETEELIETVEVLRGEGAVSHPIFSVTLLEWLYEDLSGLVFDSDSRNFTTTHATKKDSLLRITYVTRFVRFDAVGETEAQVQYLVEDC